MNDPDGTYPEVAAPRPVRAQRTGTLLGLRWALGFAVRELAPPAGDPDADPRRADTLPPTSAPDPRIDP